MALSILVVDDSAVMRSIIIKNLRATGLAMETIHQAANGLEAIRTLYQHKVDLALFDVNMPGMSGEQLLEKVRQDPATAMLPVIVVSTEGSETRIARLRELGAAFVHKPFSPEKIKETVLAMVGEAHVQSL
jgi:two-component system chemotaxis response regulator CheY